MRPRLRAAVSAAIVIGGYSRLLSQLAPAGIAAVRRCGRKGGTSSSRGAASSSKGGSSRDAGSSSEGGSSSSSNKAATNSSRGGSSKGGTISSSSTSTTGWLTDPAAEEVDEYDQAQLAWQVACQYHQQLQELPAALTDMLGVDRPLLAWLAVQDAAAGERLGTARYAAAVADLIMPGHRHAVEEELAEPPPTQQTAQGDHHQQQSLLQLQQQQQQHELHLFLAPLLFECAAGVEDGLGTIFRRDAHHIALTSAIHSLERYVEFISFQRQMDSLKLLDSNTAPQAAAAPALPQPSLAVQRLAAAVPFLEKILPPLLRLTARKLAAVRAMEAAASHGSSGSRLAAAASPAAALGRRSNDSSATAAAAVAADSFKQSHWFLVHSVSLLAHLSDSTVLLLPPSPGEARSSSTSSSTSSTSSTSSEGTSAWLVSGAGIAKAWSINALQLTALCEGYLRALAAATAQSTAAAAAAAQGTLAAATAQGAIGSTVVDLLPKEGPWAVGLMSHWCSVGGRVDNSIPNLLVMAGSWGAATVRPHPWPQTAVGAGEQLGQADRLPGVHGVGE